MSSFSTFLFANPSFVEGVARIVDFGNALNQYNACLTPEQADFFAILADWKAVGQDLNNAAIACIGPEWEKRCVQRKTKKGVSKSTCTAGTG